MPQKIRHLEDPFNLAAETSMMFVESLHDPANMGGIDELFSLKVEQAYERVKLILGELVVRKNLAKRNLELINRDLSRVNNWRLEIPCPKTYYKDKEWMDLNKMEMQLRQEIRQERIALFRDTSMNLRDFREALLEHRLQEKRSEMFDLSSLENVIEGQYKAMGEQPQKQDAGTKNR